jgi:2-dehydro-3-deoxygluconokinase
MIRIASAGECMVELRHRSDHDLELGFGGDTLNTAVYLARLLEGSAARVDYVTALGEDLYSEQMLAMWRSEGVGVAHVARLARCLPGLYTIRTDERGERTFTYWRDTSAARRTFEGDRGEALLDALAGYDLLYLSGITLSILDAPQRATLLRIAERIRAEGGKVAFDTNFRPVAWPDIEVARQAFDEMLSRTDVALPTLDDDQKLFGVASAEACAGRIHALGVPEVAVKLGARGSYVSSHDFTGPVAPAHVPRVVDSTAAGDSFNAGFLASRVQGREAGAAAALGNRLAAIVIQHRGAVIRKEATAAVRL